MVVGGVGRCGVRCGGGVDRYVGGGGVGEIGTWGGGGVVTLGLGGGLGTRRVVFMGAG